VGLRRSIKLLSKLGREHVTSFDVHPKRADLSAFYSPTLRVGKDLIAAFGITKYSKSNTDGWVEKRITPLDEAIRQRVRIQSLSLRMFPPSTKVREDPPSRM
jgi:hypothetical protein